MEEQMRLYIRLAMEDSGFHLHTSMDNNMYNLINVTRFPSFDTSARMSPLFIALYERGHLQKILLVSKIVPNLWRSMITTFVSHRGRENTYYTGGYDPVVPPVAPPPDRLGATEALIRLSVLLRQSFVLKSRLLFSTSTSQEKEKQKSSTISSSNDHSKAKWQHMIVHQTHFTINNNKVMILILPTRMMRKYDLHQTMQTSHPICFVIRILKRGERKEKEWAKKSMKKVRKTDESIPLGSTKGRKPDWATSDEKGEKSFGVGYLRISRTKRERKSRARSFRTLACKLEAGGRGPLDFLWVRSSKRRRMRLGFGPPDLYEREGETGGRRASALTGIHQPEREFRTCRGFCEWEEEEPERGELGQVERTKGPDQLEQLTNKRTAVGTPILTDGDPVGKVRESTTTVVTPHTNYGDPVGKVRTGKPTAVTPHTDYGDPVEKKTESTPTVVTPHTNYGDPVGRVRKGGRTFPERNWISCTESNSSGDSFGSRVMACVASTSSGGRTKSFSVSAGRDPVFPSEVTTYFSLSYIFLIQEEGEMCSVGTTTEEGEEETGKVKVLATVDLACGGLLSTASELCTACLIIPLVLRESASCHSSPELRGSGATTGGTTGSSLDVVGVPTSITWGATPKAVNCAVIVAMALAISAICACNCNTVASVSTERGGPPCAEVEGTSASPCSSISSSTSLCSSDVPRLVTTQTR
ncbi:hypothetical protein M5K25_003086 [Dendrobium thyrsiflorum]|uniref:Uncharacterized protein n=1 Tax=Dendrobium thyrsiflorum TaxID=117978 RepID=A0ABD0VP79_DENTH